MTPSEYMDPKRFPRSTQEGLSIEDQILRDSVNYDDVVRYEAEGRPIPPDKEAVVQELREKYAAVHDVLDQLSAARAAGRDSTPPGDGPA